MKKIISILVLVLAMTICMSTVGCKKDVKSVTIGYTDYAPMNYEENGKLVGFDTELAKMTFGDLGYKVRFKLIEWSNKYQELQSGAIDCIWNGFTANSSDDGVARSEKVNFSAYYLENNQCVVRKNGTAEITDPAQFDGKSIAYETGSAGEGYVKDVDKLENVNVNKKGVASQLDALLQVNMGTAQYAVVDKTLADNYVGKNDYTQLVVNEGITIPVEYYAIGFRKNDDGKKLADKVNQKLKEYETNGELLKLAQKYKLENRLIEILI